MLCAIALLPALPALAQPYPSKPIEFVVHTGPGGGADLLARVIADAVAKVYRSAPWQEYLARNMYEEIYLNAEDATRYVAAKQGEIAKFLTDVGLAVKK